MTSKCNSCRILRRGDTIKLICPYNENEIGLEKSRECRLKLLQILRDNNLNLTRITFSNNNIIKSYNKKRLLEYKKFCDLINSKKFEWIHKYILRLKKFNKADIMFEPIEFITNNPKLKNFLIDHGEKLPSYKFLYEISLLLEMGYNSEEVYYRIFEPDIDIDNAWFATISMIKYVKNLPCATVKILKRNNRLFYYVLLDETQYNSSKLSKLKILYEMSGVSNNLRRLAAIFEDDEIQEIYADKENSWVYIDHMNFGRCDTNVFMSSADAEKFKTAISLICGEEVSISNPSVKLNVVDTNANFRIAIDVFPVVLDTTIDIRRFNTRMLSIKDLINLKSIEAQIAAFLIFCASKRLSIVICGEPNSGKTTLANAISEFLPKEWRKIYIEDVEELYASINTTKDKSVFIKTSSVDVSDKYSSKSREIIKMLHRSPDWIFLGEIQTKEHSQAAFHALLAGLKCIMTCHASSAQDLVERWIIQHEIQPICIRSIDLIIFMERKIEENKIIRRVKNIFETDYDEFSNKITLKRIYELGEKSFSIDKDKLAKLNCIKKIVDTYQCNEENIVNEIKEIERRIQYE